MKVSKYMKKLEEKYIQLLNDSLKDKNEIIDTLLRINESIVRETRELIYEFRQYIKSNSTLKEAKKEGK